MTSVGQSLIAERFPIYHATSKSTWHEIQRSGVFNMSENTYDWLGTGVYFWQSSPLRAWIWKRYQQFPPSSQTPPEETVVLRYVLDWDPNECIDLLDVLWYSELEATGTEVVRDLRELNVDEAEVQRRIRLNSTVDRPTQHFLDCAAIDTLCRSMEEGSPHAGVINAVRGAFQNSAPVFEGSAFRLGDHVQVAIRSPVIIDLGKVETVEGLEKFEPRLSTRLFHV